MVRASPTPPTFGAVVFDGSRRPETFRAVVHPETIELWKTKLNQEQVIGQAELFPVLVARLTWPDWFKGRRVINFIDNESARLGLVKAYSPVLPSLDIISRCLCWDHVFHSTCWFARVPSDSNIGDSPSRMDASFLVGHFGAKVVKPVMPEGFRISDCL